MIQMLTMSKRNLVNNNQFNNTLITFLKKLILKLIRLAGHCEDKRVLCPVGADMWYIVRAIVS